MHKRDYISQLDKMLEQMRENTERTPQELAEIKKYNRINYLRDNPFEEPETEEII